MKCARCNRELKAATVTIGRMTVGPKCARLMGLTKTRKVAAPHMRKVVIDTDTPDLFEGVI